MKSKIFIALSLTLLSCNDIPLDELKDTKNTLLIQNRIQGIYTKCVPSNQYPGSYGQYTVEVIEDIVKFSNTLSSSSTCASPYYLSHREFSIKSAEYLDSSKTVFNLDLSVIKYEYTFYHSWYPTQNYCGLTDWAVGITKNLTGLSCPNINQRPSFKDVGDMEYTRFTLNGIELSIPTNATESGDSPQERKTTPVSIIEKI